MPPRRRPRLRAPAARPLAIAALAGALLAACVVAPGYRVGRARVVGAAEQFRVEEADLDFLGRVDTGARSSSLHAFDIEVEDGSEDMTDNPGRRVRFTVENERGTRRTLVSVIEDVAEVRSAHGSELRYRVPLHIALRGDARPVRVTLRDRTRMYHKLLVGRDWLGEAYLVDVADEFRGEREIAPDAAAAGD